jgi:NADPH-dependent ferric siderophore reductase
MTVDDPVRAAITSGANAAGPEYRLVRARVVRTAQPCPALMRVTFGGINPGEITSGGLDQRIKLLLPLPGQDRPHLPGEGTYTAVRALPEHLRPALRTYTVRAFRPQDGEIDVEFVLHGLDGPGARFAGRARPGAEVALYAPNARYPHGPRPRGVEYRLDRVADGTLLVGDETALPAIGSILESLPVDVRASVFVETAPGARSPVLAERSGLEVHWLRRNPSAPGAAALQAVRQARLGAASWYSWIAGEAGMVRQVRRHLVRERGFDRTAVTFLGYWRAGRSADRPAGAAPAVQ